MPRYYALKWNNIFKNLGFGDGGTVSKYIRLEKNDHHRNTRSMGEKPLGIFKRSMTDDSKFLMNYTA
jgi:hypothetical protein